MRPIYLLVVAAARAWDFPWSSTEEGWAPEETAPQAESDPFWVDSAPCEADTRPPRNEQRGRALTGNLLRNGDAREKPKRRSRMSLPPEGALSAATAWTVTDARLDIDQ